MPLLCLDEVCNRINHKLSEIEDPLFALFYGPVLAKERKYTELDALTRVNPYGALFKYPTAIHLKAQNICAKDFKEFLKNVITDAQAFESMSEISTAISQFAVTTIRNTREYQKQNGIFENVMTSYCPIVPYTQSIHHVDTEGAAFPNNSTVIDIVQNFPNWYYSCMECTENQGPVQTLTELAIRAPLAIIDSAGYYSSGVGIANIYQDLKWQDEKMKLGIVYWGLVSLISMDTPPNPCLVEDTWKAMDSLWATKPEEKGSFESVFTTMMKDTEMISSMENWDALPEVDQKMSRQYSDDHPRISSYEPPERHTNFFDVDKLVSAFNARRNTMTNSVTTSYVESEWKDAGISDITAFNDKITLITFGDAWMGIPFVDIPDDYSIKALCINRKGDIQEFKSPPM
ncbi:MAG: hypothetical protein NC548_05600 [Lachnospiraceae bacterium]|nr:hypothetical protein [Lachnospiraceae bacterium]